MKIDLHKIKKDKSTRELIELGIININNPSGPTSFQVSDYIKSKLKLNKTSHLGTLDPAVSGVLPVALGRACKLATYLMGSRKKYIGIMRLHEEVDDAKLKSCMKKFAGKIMQMPPVRSSVKRALREREIYSWDFIERHGKDVLFSCDVEAGTYIRTLVNDAGEEIGGAHMLELRRTEVGIFDEKSCCTLYEFDEAIDSWKNGKDVKLREIIVPGEIIGNVLKSVEIDKKNYSKYMRGSPIYDNEFKLKSETGEIISAFCEDRFVGCYKVVNSKNVFAVPDFVFN